MRTALRAGSSGSYSGRRGSTAPSDQRSTWGSAGPSSSKSEFSGGYISQQAEDLALRELSAVWEAAHGGGSSSQRSQVSTSAVGPSGYGGQNSGYPYYGQGSSAPPESHQVEMPPGGSLRPASSRHRVSTSGRVRSDYPHVRGRERVDGSISWTAYYFIPNDGGGRGSSAYREITVGTFEREEDAYRAAVAAIEAQGLSDRSTRTSRKRRAPGSRGS
jgi:hypothetical protein